MVNKTSTIFLLLGVICLTIGTILMCTVDFSFVTILIIIFNVLTIINTVKVIKNKNVEK